MPRRGEWGDGRPSCRECGETGRPHRGGGLCARCYQAAKRGDRVLGVAPVKTREDRIEWHYLDATAGGMPSRKAARAAASKVAAGIGEVVSVLRARGIEVAPPQNERIESRDVEVRVRVRYERAMGRGQSQLDAVAAIASGTGLTREKVRTMLAEMGIGTEIVSIGRSVRPLGERLVGYYETRRMGNRSPGSSVAYAAGKVGVGVDEAREILASMGVRVPANERPGPKPEPPKPRPPRVSSVPRPKPPSVPSVARMEYRDDRPYDYDPVRLMRSMQEGRTPRFVPMAEIVRSVVERDAELPWTTKAGYR